MLVKTRSGLYNINRYATDAKTDALIQRGAEYRRKRLASIDMLSTDDAAELAGTSRVSINLWIKKG